MIVQYLRKLLGVTKTEKKVATLNEESHTKHSELNKEFKKTNRAIRDAAYHISFVIKSQ